MTQAALFLWAKMFMSPVPVSRTRLGFVLSLRRMALWNARMRVELVSAS